MQGFWVQNNETLRAILWILLKPDYSFNIKNLFMKTENIRWKQVFRRERGPTWFSPTQVSYILRTCFSRSSSILPSPPRLDSPDTKIRTRIEMIQNNSAKCTCEYLQLFTRIFNSLLDGCNLQLFILDPVKSFKSLTYVLEYTVCTYNTCTVTDDLVKLPRHLALSAWSNL